MHLVLLLSMTMFGDVHVAHITTEKQVFINLSLQSKSCANVHVSVLFVYKAPIEPIEIETDITQHFLLANHNAFYIYHDRASLAMMRAVSMIPYSAHHLNPRA